MSDLIARFGFTNMLRMAVRRDRSLLRWAAQFEAEALEIRRARQPADVVELLQDGGLKAELGQFVGGGQSARPAADDDEGALGVAVGHEFFAPWFAHHRPSRERRGARMAG